MIALENLKNVCGYEYTSKLGRMFTDITLSTELAKYFKTYVDERNANTDGEFYVNVLTAGSWPFSGNTLEYQVPYQVMFKV
jgi:hypothetical protein